MPDDPSASEVIRPPARVSSGPYGGLRIAGG
jgi:hypothetical protein